MKANALSGSYLSTAKYNADPEKPVSSPWVGEVIGPKLVEVTPDGSITAAIRRYRLWR